MNVRVNQSLSGPSRHAEAEVYGVTIAAMEVRTDRNRCFSRENAAEAPQPLPGRNAFKSLLEALKQLVLRAGQKRAAHQ